LTWCEDGVVTVAFVFKSQIKKKKSKQGNSGS